ncbi:MAG: deoxynucleoside kinase [Flavobacteriales bacterium]|nr:deoxynucleoside kinase [Flavobacteriales bacterium]|tara:strand:+ start:36835 stop:37473 length:639 start_codon:yes stop_codon:yes gene_type:complete
MQYKHVAVEGNIGSGKTTLASMLANDSGARLILEEFAENPFLPKFYKDPDKHAFPLELFFMAERYYQLKNLDLQDLFQPYTVSDYFFIKSKIFAQNNLKTDEMQLFNKLFDIMLSSLSKPDLVVYLYADINRLQQNIKKRGRDFEQDISDEYLYNIQNKYLDYLKKQDDFPVLILDVTNIDFVKDESIYRAIKACFSESFSGVNHKALEPSQ